MVSLLSHLLLESETIILTTYIRFALANAINSGEEIADSLSEAKSFRPYDINNTHSHACCRTVQMASNSKFKSIFVLGI